MLSIAKINSSSNQAKISVGSGDYLFYLNSPSTRQRSDFLDYLQNPEIQAPAAFWAGSGPSEFNLPNDVQQEAVEKLSLGFSPITGKPLVRGAGPLHVKGVDMTFSPPKDVSALFAGTDPPMQEAINLGMQKAVKSAIAYSESVSITRHGKAGRTKHFAKSILAACYPHFASRALQPQLHVHAFLFNLGKRQNGEWSALDHKAQFDHKMTTGMLFRVELAHQLSQLGFEIIPDRQYFKIKGVSEHQRKSLSKRRSEIQAYMTTHEGGSSKEAEIAALNTRASKAEPHYLDLIQNFKSMVAELGITADYVESLRFKNNSSPPEEFKLSHQEVLEELIYKRSTVTVQEALHLICVKSMGRWNADQCRAYLEEFLVYADVLHLGNTEHLTQIITSKQRYEQEKNISLRVEQGVTNQKFKINPRKIELAFQRLQEELSASLGVSVKLDEQRAAAKHICSDTGSHAFIVGSAGTGKTTLLKAVAEIYKSEGYEVLGCSQSASASLNLSREDTPLLASCVMTLTRKEWKDFRSSVCFKSRAFRYLRNSSLNRLE